MCGCQNYESLICSSEVEKEPMHVNNFVCCYGYNTYPINYTCSNCC